MRNSVVILSLTAVLVLLWLVLSGRWQDTFVLSLGAGSVVFVVLLVGRLGILDQETAPQARIGPLLAYWGWLGGEIGKSAIAVTRVVLSPQMDITPRLVRVPARAKTGLGRATFANSITLTPGTVTVAVEADAFVVHALSADFADDAAFTEIGTRAARAVEGADV